MSKSTVTRIFLGGMIAVLGGVALAIAAVWLAIANEVFVLNGSDIVALRGSILAWSLGGVGLVAAGAILAGSIAGVVAWIGALLNTSRLESKRWFVGLVVLGIFSLGFVAMLVWIVAGPDGSATPAERPIRRPAAATPA